MDSWVDVEAALQTVNVEEITAEAIRAYLDLPEGGIKEVEMFTNEQIVAYYGEYSNKSKTYKTLRGRWNCSKNVGYSS